MNKPLSEIFNFRVPFFVEGMLKNIVKHALWLFFYKKQKESDVLLHQHNAISYDARAIKHAPNDVRQQSWTVRSQVAKPIPYWTYMWRNLFSYPPPHQLLLYSINRYKWRGEEEFECIAGWYSRCVKSCAWVAHRPVLIPSTVY